MPALCLFALFSIYPIARTFYLSFFDYSVVDPPRPVGLENYRQHPRRSDDFTTSLFNSFRYVVFTYVPVWILALLLALALNTRIKARAIFRTIYFVPVVMSWVVVSVIWKLIFHRNGLLNTMFLDPIGIPPQELADRSSSSAPDAIVIMSVWKEVGFFMVIFLAGLQNIPSRLHSKRPESMVVQPAGLPLHHAAALATDHPLRDGHRHDRRDCRSSFPSS